MTRQQSHRAASSPLRLTAAHTAALGSLENCLISDHAELATLIAHTEAEKLPAVQSRIAASAAKVAARHIDSDSISFPENLPVSARVEDIAHAISHHQVVVIAGETGSGKTTQIPKICLQLGRGRRGQIAHTQPRRIAARTVAARIAQELNTPVGKSVGYSIRFDDQVSASSNVKVMTDGILLAEIHHDPLLLAYDTIIIDEAHERSLNIDFLLGYLKNLCRSRADLKIIITSATIDPQRFADHFSTPGGQQVPVIEVSGRTYPVEIRYRELSRVNKSGATESIDLVDGVSAAVRELLTQPEGDILVFLPGERDIRECAKVLTGQFPSLDIFPLYARLSRADQDKAYNRSSQRRVVLSTNIAETSVTIPGISYVVDSGLARISRYSTRNRVQRLPVERISQASAKQRSGRCGRTSNGICIRLCSEEEFLDSPPFTDPEILRTNLASVLLTMARLELGLPTSFPFIDPPARSAVNSGIKLLQQLQAVTLSADGQQLLLTDTGRSMSLFPVDPRMSRVLVEAHRRNCLHHALIIVAGMSGSDIREYPTDEHAQAVQSHSRFNNPDSDFMVLVSLWNHVDAARKELSSSAFRKLCKREYLHWMRSREWKELYEQLRTICLENSWACPEHTADYATLHTCLISGFVTNIGVRHEDGNSHRSVTGSTMRIGKQSTIGRKQPPWIVAGSLIDTGLLWAAMVAKIEPEWIEDAAPHLLSEEVYDQHWSAKKGAAVANIRVRFLGLTIAEQRVALLRKFDKPLARELFIAHALVSGETKPVLSVVKDNLALVEKAREMQLRQRRHDLVWDDEELAQYFDRLLPRKITSVIDFNRWWKTCSVERKQAFSLTDEQIHHVGQRASTTDFPSVWKQGDMLLPLTYHHQGQQGADGITIDIPVHLLTAVKPVGFEWLVPGMRLSLYEALIRGLPKHIRRSFSPAAEYATLIHSTITPRTKPLARAVAEELSQVAGYCIDKRDVAAVDLPGHLTPSFNIVDPAGKSLGQGKDLAKLSSRLGATSKLAFEASVVKLVLASSDTSCHELVNRVGVDVPMGQQSPWTDDILGHLPQRITVDDAGHEVEAFPTLVHRSTDNGSVLTVALFQSAAAAQQALVAAQITMLRSYCKKPKTLSKGRQLSEKVALASYPYGGESRLTADISMVVAREALAHNGGPARSGEEFKELLHSVNTAVGPRSVKLVSVVIEGLCELSNLHKLLNDSSGKDVEFFHKNAEILCGAGFLVRHKPELLQHCARYCAALALGAAQSQEESGKTSEHIAQLQALRERIDERVSAAPRTYRPHVHELNHMYFELLVSYFAQRLGTSMKISAERLTKRLDAIAASR